MSISIKQNKDTICNFLKSVINKPITIIYTDQNIDFSYYYNEIDFIFNKDYIQIGERRLDDYNLTVEFANISGIIDDINEDNITIVFTSGASLVIVKE